MEQQDDGTIKMREVNLLEDRQTWSSYYDGVDFLLSINLKCEGENIKSVNFYTDDGFFAKQYLKMKNGKIILEDGVPASFSGNGDGTYTITMYGDDFEKIGSSFTLNKDDMTDDLLLFIGTSVTNRRDFPSQMIIRAVATFNDGKTQEETLIVDLTKGMGLGRINLPEDEIIKQFESTDDDFEFTVEIEINEEIAETGSYEYSVVTISD